MGSLFWTVFFRVFIPDRGAIIFYKHLYNHFHACFLINTFSTPSLFSRVICYMFSTSTFRKLHHRPDIMTISERKKLSRPFFSFTVNDIDFAKRSTLFL